MDSTEKPRLLVLGAHPDDAEFHAGGLIARYRKRDCPVKMVSVTNGGAGHHRLDSETLVSVRTKEFRASGEEIGAEAETWTFPDGALQPTLQVREAIIREIRTFAPDLVLTHRTCDYHPDHRAVGQAVQDASYMVTVPLVVPQVPILTRDPVVAYMVDLFTKPCPFDPQVVIDIQSELETIVGMLAHHECQVFDFLPYNMGLGQVPSDRDDRLSWLRDWLTSYVRERSESFSKRDGRRYPELIEAYEISEYASALDESRRAWLFGDEVF